MLVYAGIIGLKIYYIWHDHMIDHALPASYIHVAVCTVYTWCLVCIFESVNIMLVSSSNRSSSVLSTVSVTESINESDKSDEEESQETSR